MNKIIKFSAKWCSNCITLEPIFKRFKELHQDFLFEEIDVDKDYETASHWGIKSIPHILFIKNDKVVAQIKGLTAVDYLNIIYNEHFSQKSAQ